MFLQSEQLPDLKKKIDEIRGKGDKNILKDMLSGKEIMDTLDIAQGKEVGKAKELLKEIEDDYDKDQAKEELKKRYTKKACIRKESIASKLSAIAMRISTK